MVVGPLWVVWVCGYDYWDCSFVWWVMYFLGLLWCFVFSVWSWVGMFVLIFVVLGGIRGLVLLVV